MMRSARTLLGAAVVACTAILAACGGSSGASAPLPPSAPTALTATAGYAAVSLSWSAAGGATSYKVYRSQATGALSTKIAITTVSSGVTYVDATAANGTTYYYQVTALNAAGESGGSNEAVATPSVTGPPVAPTGVTATPADGQVTITWTNVPGATSYDLYRATSSPVTTSSAKITGVASPYVDSPLTNGTTYYYAVVAVNNVNGPSALSAEVSATPNLPPPYIEATVLRWAGSVATNSPVVEVRVCTDSSCATKVTDATVTVNGTAAAWTAGAGEYRSTQTIAAGATVSLSVLVPGNSVAAAGTYGASGQMYSTPPAVTAPTTSTTWERAVDNTVTWTAGAPASTTPASIYVVGLQDAAGDFFPINANNSPSTAAITASSFTVPADSLPAAGTYTVFVGIGTTGIVDGAGAGISIPGAATGSALYIGHCSPLITFSVTAATPATPTGLVAKALNGAVDLSWSAPSGATGYQIYRGTSPTGGIANKTLIGTVSSTAYSDTTVTNGVAYYYQVVATNGNGDSAPSTQVSATPGPAPYIRAKVIRWAMPAPANVPVREVQVCAEAACTTPIDTATVQVNSQNVPWNATDQRYAATGMVPEGAAVTLTVIIPDGELVASGTYTVTGTMYATAPAITSPAASATWDSTAANTITWSAGAPTATTPPSAYVVGIVDGAGTYYPTSTINGPLETAIASGSYTLAANTIGAPGPFKLFVGIGTQFITMEASGGIAIPDAATGSGLYLGNVGATVAVTVF